MNCPNATFTSGVPGTEEALNTGLVTTIDDEVGWELNGMVTYSYNKHVTLTMAAAVFWPGDGAEVLAQCSNFAKGKKTGCDPGINEDDEDKQLRVTNSRADDEAVKVAVELMVQY